MYLYEVNVELTPKKHSCIYNYSLMDHKYEKVYVYTFHVNFQIQGMCIHWPALTHSNIYNDNTMHFFEISK